MYNENGKIIGTIGASIDITEEKNKAEQQKKARVFEQLKMIAPFIPANVYWLDENNTIIGVNEKTLQAIGLSSYEDIIGKTVYDLYPHKLAETIAQHHLETMKTRKTLKHEELIKDVKTGQTKYFTTVKTPLYDEDKIIGSIGISIDITERRRMEQELRSLKEAAQTAKEEIKFTLSNIIENMPGHIYWKNKEGFYLGCNKQQAESLGFHESSEVIGKTDFELFEEHIATFIRKNDIKIMESDKMEILEERKNLDSDKVVLSQKAPLKNDKGNVKGILGISIDITERKKMEQELIVAKENAEMASKAKAEFLRNMEHQLRTPFSGVYSLVHMLADEEQDPKKKELLEITYSSGKELLDFLNDVISFSRSQTETNAILVKKFNLKELIERAINMEKPAAVIKKLALKFDYPAELPTIFISDPKRIQRIILNLLSNAIKFTPKGSVSISVQLGRPVADKIYIIRLLFADTGIGIAKENQSLIYERFYRGTPANQNKYQGAGLGLHIVKELIDDLEGEIDLKSKLNEGSTFICTLSLKRPLLDEVITDE